MQALHGCEAFGKSLLTDTSSCGMRGEPGIHMDTFSPSSSIASPVSSCGSEYSVTVGSPDDHQNRSGRQHQNRASMMHKLVVNDTGLDSVMFLSM